MINIIKKLLLKIIDDIDCGNSNVTEEEALNIIDDLQRFTNKDERFSKYKACEYLHISRATFDKYIREGKLPQGIHTIGFKEKSWSKKDLDKFIKENKK